MYTLVKSSGLDSAFPNVEVALRIYLSLMITNYSGERSFSHLKRVKNEIRSTMLQDRVSNLSLTYIESELLRNIDFDDIVRGFASRKSRKVPIV